MFSFNLLITPEMLQPHYQHLNHADAVRLLEAVRINFLAARGVSLERLYQADYFLVVASLNLRYRKELVCGQVHGEVLTAAFKSRVLHLTQRLTQITAQPAVEAELSLVGISGKTRRSVLPPKFLFDAISAPSGEVR